MLRLSALATTAALVALPVAAHHSFAMFDTSKQVMLEGTVETWAFNNPHTWLFIEVDVDGESQRWGFEGSAPVSQLGRGITGETFQPGDTVRVVMCPMRDGRQGGHMAFVQLEDGSVVTPNDAGCPAGPNVERWQTNGWLESAANFDAYLVEDARATPALQGSPIGNLVEVPEGQ
jgi:hypothetical protein